MRQDVAIGGGSIAGVSKGASKTFASGYLVVSGIEILVGRSMKRRSGMRESGISTDGLVSQGWVFLFASILLECSPASFSMSR